MKCFRNIFVIKWRKIISVSIEKSLDFMVCIKYQKNIDFLPKYVKIITVKYYDEREKV